MRESGYVIKRKCVYANGGKNIPRMDADKYGYYYKEQIE